MLTKLATVNTAEMFLGNHMWQLYFPYFGKHDRFNGIEDQAKGLPVHDKSNWLHSDF